MINATILVVFPFSLALAALSDLLTMTIPNRVSLVLLVSFSSSRRLLVLISRSLACTP